MSDYRRLISYIYAYEGGVKGRNIGFAKIETRAGQCKIQVSVRRIYVGGQDVGVYLLSADREILLGKIFLRGGSGEFRAVVPFDNIDGSGRGMDQCYGLTIHSLDDAWRCYTTIWEDAVAHAAAVELENVTSANAEAKEMERAPAAEITEKTLADMDGLPRESVTESIEREIAGGSAVPPVKMSKQAEVPQPGMPPMEVPQPEVPPVLPATEIPRPEVPQTPQSPTEIPRPDAPQPPTEIPQPDAPQPSQSPTEVPQTPQEVSRPSAIDMISSPTSDSLQPSSFGTAFQQTSETDSRSAAGAVPPQTSAETPSQSVPPAEGQPAGQLPPPDSAEQAERDDIGRLWSHFKRHYPKIQAFDYHGGCEVLLIKPQDIGLLPRETWSYGNNSFLLHGYYNHRYLILARLSSPNGVVRFLLGVPGHYYSNEKYMASMFGFPNFVLSKMQPAGDGRFGYWYTDIRLTEAGTGVGKSADQ